MRAEVSYRWPTTLRVPARPPTLVYLDLNHWVSLAKAHTGHGDGERFRDAMDVVVQAQADGRAVFPISDSTFFEVSKIGQFRQRRDLRDVIEVVSGYFVVTSRTVIATHEIEAALDEIVGPSSRPINSMDYLDWGVARAFGMVGGFKVSDGAGNDVTENARADFPGGPEAFDELCAGAELQLIRSVLAGPSPEEEGLNCGRSDGARGTKTESVRSANHRWTSNDIHDIDALGSTVPYCDIVVTDRAVASHLHRTGVAERLDTIVLSSLDDLVSIL